jgi:hypothetical protein
MVKYLSMATLLYDNYSFGLFITIILLKIKCSLQYIYMYIVYSSVAMEGPFTLVKEGGYFHLVKNKTQTTASYVIRLSST